MSGATGVTLFVPTPPGGLFQPILLHDGDGPPVPELVDLASAERFFRQQRQAHGADRAPDSIELVRSTAADCGLITLPGVEAPWELARFGVEQPARRRSDGDHAHADDRYGAWLGLRFPDGRGSVLERLTSSHVPTKILEDGDSHLWWDWLFVMGGALASHTTQVTAILKDPVTGLADRKAFQAVLNDQMERALQDELPMSLLMINPDQFDAVNERLGREAGDHCVREISERLRPVLRMTDFVARYGGVVFAVLLPDTPESEALEVAQRVMEEMATRPFLDGGSELAFSVGLSSLQVDGQEPPERPLDLVRRADRALNTAKRDGGARIVRWRPEAQQTEGGGRDRLSGIFTGNMSKDYRNMALLRDTLDILAHGTDFVEVAREVVDKLYSAFSPDRIGIFTGDQSGRAHLICGLTRRDSSSGLQSRMETIELEPHEEQQVEAAFKEARPRDTRSPGAAGDDSSADSGRVAFVAPLTAGAQTLGCLFIEGRRSSLTLDTSDLIFLESLGAQVAVALDRARLTRLERDRQEQERRRLRAELSELRQALQHVKMVYRSPEMEELVATVKRVAPTDATVLIIGESGTGKELLARTVHELSRRQDHPFVIVDCGAISSTLIESELFGHERGAYTGAQARRQGRLVEARDGTVVLDEIGELPLEVQSKLLRFVQDKQLTTVGGSKTQTVDVRIVAATNRDLAAEVAAGRFREDLYHRLNVVCLEIPPLRERPHDILHLARHFLELFAVQYQKGVRQFSAEAEEQLLGYSWPGNVRELQNRILQSVILCEGDVIGSHELGIAAAGSRAPTTTGLGGPEDESAAAIDATLEPPGEDLWFDLQQHLGDLIGASTSASPPLRFPLGTWLRDDLLIEAAAASDQAVREAALLVGMPESTFRRRLRMAVDNEEAGLASRMQAWDRVRRTVAELVRSPGAAAGELLARTQETLLREILARFPGDAQTGSQLLGVSPPTFRRRAKQLQSAD